MDKLVAELKEIRQQMDEGLMDGYEYRMKLLDTIYNHARDPEICEAIMMRICLL